MLGSRMRGPLAQYASGFRDELVELGYAPSSARRQMEVMSQLSGWMMQTGLRPRELTPDAVGRFLAHRRGQGRTYGISPSAMAVLRGYLRRLGAVPGRAVLPAVDGIGRIVAEYQTYLVNGVAPCVKTAGPPRLSNSLPSLR